MKCHRIAVSFCVSMLLLVVSTGYAAAFNAEVLPAEVRQGDAFAVQVSGEQMSEAPSADFNGEKLRFSPCGDGCYVAVGAVDIDTRPGTYKITIEKGSETLGLQITVQEGTFPEIHLTLPEEKVFPGPENEKRILQEIERLNAIWINETDRKWEGVFILPLGNEISTVFGTKRIINRKKNSLHRGMDIRGREGEEIKASNSGRVELAEELFFGGNTVILDHGMGIFSVYMHLSSFKVKKEDMVSKGDLIGHVGSTGRVTGPHLHFGIKVLNINADPASLIRLPL